MTENEIMKSTSIVYSLKPYQVLRQDRVKRNLTALGGLVDPFQL